MRAPTRAVLAVLATTALVAGGGTATAAEYAVGWTAPNDGVTVSDDGVVTLVDSDTTGVSYENQDLDVVVANGDRISFEYLGDCSGGAPRVFIQGGAYNTFDQDPNNVTDEPACGTDTDGDGWWTVTTTIEGVTEGPAGYTGIVNDSSDDRTISVRNLVIAGNEIDLAAEEADGGGEPAYNHGQCVKSADKSGEARSQAAKSDCGKTEHAQKQGAKHQRAA
jgi:hypothetical protein